MDVDCTVPRIADEAILTGSIVSGALTCSEIFIVSFSVVAIVKVRGSTSGAWGVPGWNT